MTAPCFATVAFEHTVLHHVVRNINPISIEVHLQTAGYPSVVCGPAVFIVAAGLTCSIKEVFVDVMSL